MSLIINVLTVDKLNPAIDERINAAGQILFSMPGNMS